MGKRITRSKRIDKEIKINKYIKKNCLVDGVEIFFYLKDFSPLYLLFLSRKIICVILKRILHKILNHANIIFIFPKSSFSKINHCVYAKQIVIKFGQVKEGKRKLQAKMYNEIINSSKTQI